MPWKICPNGEDYTKIVRYWYVNEGSSDVTTISLGSHSAENISGVGREDISDVFVLSPPFLL